MKANKISASKGISFIVCGFLLFALFHEDVDIFGIIVTAVSAVLLFLGIDKIVNKNFDKYKLLMMSFIGMCVLYVVNCVDNAFFPACITTIDEETFETLITDYNLSFHILEIVITLLFSGCRVLFTILLFEALNKRFDTVLPVEANKMFAKRKNIVLWGILYVVGITLESCFQYKLLSMSTAILNDPAGADLSNFGAISFISFAAGIISIIYCIKVFSILLIIRRTKYAFASLDYTANAYGNDSYDYNRDTNLYGAQDPNFTKGKDHDPIDADYNIKDDSE